MNALSLAESCELECVPTPFSVNSAGNSYSMIEFGSNFVKFVCDLEYRSRMLLLISAGDQLFGGPLKYRITAGTFY